MFISKPYAGRIYVARRARAGFKLLWSIIPVAPIADEARIEAHEVPRVIRHRAYKLFEGDRLREDK